MPGGGFCGGAIAGRGPVPVRVGTPAAGVRVPIVGSPAAGVLVTITAGSPTRGTPAAGVVRPIDGIAWVSPGLGTAGGRGIAGCWPVGGRAIDGIAWVSLGRGIAGIAPLGRGTPG